jgi:hypothetical protein
MTDKRKAIDSIIIFYRPKTNAEECIANQQAFTKSYIKNQPEAKIDYASSENHETTKIIDLIKKGSNKVILVMQSALTKKKFNKEYKHLIFFNFYKKLGMLDIYLMDSHGNLYKEVKNIKKI